MMKDDFILGTALGISCPLFQDIKQAESLQLLQQPHVPDFGSKRASASKFSSVGGESGI